MLADASSDRDRIHPTSRRRARAELGQRQAKASESASPGAGATWRPRTAPLLRSPTGTVARLGIGARAAKSSSSLACGPSESIGDHGGAAMDHRSKSSLIKIAFVLFAVVIAAGVSVRVQGPKLLLHAASRGSMSMMRVLVCLGVDPASNAPGSYPLYAAVSHGQHAAAEFLLEAGSPVDSVERDGATPLMRAAVSRRRAGSRAAARSRGLDAGENGMRQRLGYRPGEPSGLRRATSRAGRQRAVGRSASVRLGMARAFPVRSCGARSMPRRRRSSRAVDDTECQTAVRIARARGPRRRESLGREKTRGGGQRPAARGRRGRCLPCALRRVRAAGRRGTSGTAATRASPRRASGPHRTPAPATLPAESWRPLEVPAAARLP